MRWTRAEEHSCTQRTVCVCVIVSTCSGNISIWAQHREEHPLRWKRMHTSSSRCLALPSPSHLAVHMQQGPRPRYSIAVCCAPDEKAQRHRGCTCLKARKGTFVNHNSSINTGFNRGFSGGLAGVHLAVCFTSRVAHFTGGNVTEQHPPPHSRDDGLRGWECIWIHLHKDCATLTGRCWECTMPIIVPKNQSNDWNVVQEGGQNEKWSLDSETKWQLCVF